MGVEVDVQQYSLNNDWVLDNTLACTEYFNNIFKENEYDAVIVRGDRYEMLPIAMLAAYKKIPLIHIEGGDISGMIDNKVRYAITALADLHFPTNAQSKNRLIDMGVDASRVFNYGSLDVEYAKTIEVVSSDVAPYAVMCYHPIGDEDPALIEKLLKNEFDGEIKVIKSNSDDGKPYGTEEYEPDKYLAIIKEAKILVGNSSSFIKEASAYGKPVVLIGNRQKGRLLTHNVIHVKYDPVDITVAIRQQLQSKYEPDETYSQFNTSELIAYQIKEFLK